MRKILFLILIFTSLYAQHDYVDWFAKKGQNGVSPFVPIVSTGNIWIGTYAPLNTNADTALAIVVNHLWFRFWKPLNTRTWNGYTYELAGSTEDLRPVLDSGLNNITLTTPIYVEPEYHYSVKIIGNSNDTLEKIMLLSKWIIRQKGWITKLQFYMKDDSALGTTFGLTSVSQQKQTTTDITSSIVDWEIYTGSNNFFSVRMYGDTAPAFLMYGNSIYSGTTNNLLPNVPEHYRSGADPIIMSWFDYSFTLGSHLATYFQTSEQNVSIASEQTTAMITRSHTDLVGMKALYTFLEGGVNDIHLGGADANTVHLRRVRLIDSVRASGGIPIVESITYSVAFSLATNQAIDTLNALDSAYCLANNIKWMRFTDILGQDGNHYALKRCFNVAVDSLHPNRNGNARKFREYADYFGATYSHVDTGTVVYANFQVKPDTIVDRQPLIFTDNVFGFMGVDSGTFVWRNGINGTDSTIYMLWDSASSVSNITDYWHCVFNTDAIGGDTIYYTGTYYGKTSISNTGHFILKSRVYALLTDSLRYVFVWSHNNYLGFYPNYSLAVSVGVPKIGSLYPNNYGLRDSLYQYQGSTVDSISIANCIYLAGATNRLATVDSIRTEGKWTMMIAYRGYSPANYLYIGTRTGATRDIYLSTGNTSDFESSVLNYYANWGIGGVDSVVTVTSDGNLYMNGNLRKTSVSTTNTALTLEDRFQGNVRIYAIAKWNKILDATAVDTNSAKLELLY